MWEEKGERGEINLKKKRIIYTHESNVKSRRITRNRFYLFFFVCVCGLYISTSYIDKLFKSNNTSLVSMFFKKNSSLLPEA
jgi:hypothetical protein